MNFFERQASARRTSRRWVVLFALAVTAIVVAIDAVVVALLSMYRQRNDYVFHDTYVVHGHQGLYGPVFWTSLIVLAVIIIASLYKSTVLRAGGRAVALAAGGVRIDRNATDAANKRLLNIVEEMAIASGVPVPEVYVLEQEASINAFAAGHSPANAAIAVTRGAMTTLTRSELQGVIAHEFSHLLNGDMRLNIKLMGLLFGILVIAVVGRFVLRFAPRGGGDRRSGGTVIVVVLAALAIMAIGYIGLFFGRLIQAAVARSRESLADASAVQFTRDPLGLRGALVKIGALEAGSRLREAQADEIAHMLFAPGMSRLFATHPPLTSRLRALDPTFRESEFDAMRKQLATRQAANDAGDDEPPVSSRERLNNLLGGGIAPAPAAVAQLVGAPSPAHIEAAQTIFASLPENIVQAAADISSSRGLFFALALDDEPETQARQLKFIGAQLGQNVASEVEAWLAQAKSLDIAQRQPALLRLFPALRRLSQAERTSLLICLTGLLQREGKIAFDKYALRKLAQVHLRESLAAPSLPGRATLDMQTENLALLFAVLAEAGTEDSLETRRAYEAGMSSLFPRSRPDFVPPGNWSQRLDNALNQLDRLAPPAKELVVQAIVKTISTDNKLTAYEAELVRAVCAALHCPLPPLVGTTN